MNSINNYYLKLDKEPLYKIIIHFKEYRFENAMHAIWNRSRFVQLGMIFACLIAIPWRIIYFINNQFRPIDSTKTISNLASKVTVLGLFIWMLIFFVIFILRIFTGLFYILFVLKAYTTGHVYTRVNPFHKK